MYELTYISHTGKSFHLYGGQIEVAEGGIEKLVGVVKDQTHTTIGMPGQTLESQILDPIRGSLTVLVESAPGLDADGLSRQLRGAFHHRKYGQLVLATPWGPARLKVRSDGILPEPTEVNGRGTIKEMRIPLVSDDAVWRLGPYESTGRAEINNIGDVPVYVEVIWQESAGIFLPSGAFVSLPAADSPRRMLLNSWDSCVVLDENGAEDPVIWDQIEVIPEGVPPGQRRDFRMASTVKVRWEIGILDPWR